MWIFKKILKNTWTINVIDDLLSTMKKELELMNSIKAHNLEHFGQIMRNEGKYGLFQIILEGKIVR